MWNRQVTEVELLLFARTRLDVDFVTFCLEAAAQCFSTAGPRPGTGTWHQLYRSARGSPGICHFSFLSNFHE